VDIAAASRLVVTGSLALLVLTIGMRFPLADAFYLFRRPRLLLRSLVAMNLLAPILALLVVKMLDLRPEIEIALVALSLAPVPPVLPNKQLKLVDAEEFAIGLFFAISLCSIVIVPLVMELFQRIGYVSTHVRWSDITKIVAVTVLVPLVLGMLIRSIWPGVPERLRAIAGAVATVMMVVALVPILVRAWPAMYSLFGDGTIVVVVVVTLLWLAIGHVLGGPRQQDRSVLALATASRHPAVAIAVVTTSFPDQPLAPAAVLLAFIVGNVVSMPYVAWRKSVLARSGHAGKPTVFGVK
jgi:BASS family bile acid:Na+ symporter